MSSNASTVDTKMLQLASSRVRIKVKRAVTVLVFSVSCVSQMNAKTAVDISRQVVIDERVNKVGTRTVIAVDKDDVVHEITVGMPDKPGPVLTANLGVRIVKSGDLDLVQILPSKKVATMSRRVTLANNTTMHVLVAWGFSSDDPTDNEPHCFLYVFRERKDKVEKLLEKEAGSYMEQFIVEDINKDGDVEILLTTRDGHIETMSIYQIETDGAVEFVQDIEADYIHTIADRFLDGNFGIYVENKNQRSAAASACFLTAEYKWSNKQQQFVKESR